MSGKAGGRGYAGKGNTEDGKGGGKHRANVYLNKRISSAADGGIASLLETLASEDPEALNHVNCCTALNRLARLATSSNAKKKKASIGSWFHEKSVDLGKGKRLWYTLPGLFAGGTLDIMTSLLLDRLVQILPTSANILDFGCGSGTLAAGLQDRLGKDIEVTLLDADAVALEAAKRNLPKAKAVLGDGFLALQNLEAEGSLFDFIVSNPPVHRGRPDDWRVLRELLKGAPMVLRPGGQLWLVVQEHVPVGRLISLASDDVDGDFDTADASDSKDAYSSGCWDDIEMECTDGRFAVWSATWNSNGRSKGRANGLKADSAADASKEVVNVAVPSVAKLKRKKQKANNTVEASQEATDVALPSLTKLKGKRRKTDRTIAGADESTLDIASAPVDENCAKRRKHAMH